MIELSFWAVEDAMEQIVQKVGFEYRYTAPNCDAPFAGQNCYNWHESDSGEKTPGCIVGTVLHHLGVKLEDMEMGGGSNYLIGQLERIEVIKFNSERDKKRILALLRTAQVAQDAGATWYSAFKVASNVVTYLD